MLMNFIFHEKLDDFVIIYIDDIMEYSKSAKKHAMHLEFVLQKFKENKLTIRWLGEKWVCKFGDGIFGAWVLLGRDKIWTKENWIN